MLLGKGGVLGEGEALPARRAFVEFVAGVALQRHLFDKRYVFG